MLKSEIGICLTAVLLLWWLRDVGGLSVLVLAVVYGSVAVSSDGLEERTRKYTGIFCILTILAVLFYYKCNWDWGGDIEYLILGLIVWIHVSFGFSVVLILFDYIRNQDKKPSVLISLVRCAVGAAGSSGVLLDSYLAQVLQVHIWIFAVKLIWLLAWCTAIGTVILTVEYGYWQRKNHWNLKSFHENPTCRKEWLKAGLLTAGIGIVLSVFYDPLGLMLAFIVLYGIIYLCWRIRGKVWFMILSGVFMAVEVSAVIGVMVGRTAGIFDGFKRTDTVIMQIVSFVVMLEVLFSWLSSSAFLIWGNSWQGYRGLRDACLQFQGRLPLLSAISASVWLWFWRYSLVYKNVTGSLAEVWLCTEFITGFSVFTVGTATLVLIKIVNKKTQESTKDKK